MTAYDSNNVFAKILRGEFACYKVYEDDHVLAFLDIMPRAAGHTLVIPKALARNILDIKIDDYLNVARATHKIAGAAMKALVVAYLGLLAALPPASRKEEPRILEEHAAKLAAALK